MSPLSRLFAAVAKMVESVASRMRNERALLDSHLDETRRARSRFAGQLARVRRERELLRQFIEREEPKVARLDPSLSARLRELEAMERDLSVGLAGLDEKAREMEHRSLVLDVKSLWHSDDEN